MVLIMNGELLQMITDTKEELKSIRQWINAGNQFDSKTRYLISYSVIKASGEKDKLNSLVQLRNDFAHGDSIAVSIDTVIKYFDSAINILNILDEVCT